MKELRCLVFTDQEVVKAVIDRRRRMREPLPLGTVQGVSYEGNEDAGVRTTLKIVDDDGAPHPLTVPEPEVAAALVAYCMNRKVPLPVESDKWLHRVNGSLTLMISMNFNRRPHVADNAVPLVKPAKDGQRAPRAVG